MGTLKEVKQTGTFQNVQESQAALLDILEDRHGRRSTLFFSKLPVASWHGVIGDSTIADAVMDRIIYGSIRIKLKGESFRNKLYQGR